MTLLEENDKTATYKIHLTLTITGRYKDEPSLASDVAEKVRNVAWTRMHYGQNQFWHLEDITSSGELADEHV